MIPVRAVEKLQIYAIFIFQQNEVIFNMLSASVGHDGLKAIR